MIPKNKSGVTLVEVLVAIGIFAIAMVILFAAITSATLYTARARHREAAIFIAKEEMEDLFRMAANGEFDDLPALDGTTLNVFLDPPNNGISAQIQRDINQYGPHVEKQGANTATIAVGECLEVGVTVAWNDFEWNGLRFRRSATASTETLYSIVARR